MLDLVVERLRRQVAIGDPLSCEFATWLGVHRDDPLMVGVASGLWTPREVAIAGLRDASGRRPARPFSAGLAALRGRQFFTPHSPGVFEADPLAILSVAIGVRHIADRDGGRWIADLAVRAMQHESDDWRVGLLAATTMLFFEEAVRRVPPELVVALSARGLGKFDEDTAKKAIEAGLAFDDASPDQAAVRLAALHALTVATTAARVYSTPNEFTVPANGPRQVQVPHNTSESGEDKMIVGNAPVRVFVSYSQEDDVQKQRVQRFVTDLRVNGIDAHFDREVHGTPPMGWPRWMESQITEADFVLVVCTEVYLRRYEQREQLGKGKGAIWEGAIIRQELYDSAGVNEKFAAILFNESDQVHQPQPLRSHTYYVYDRDRTNLLRWLTNQPAYIPPALGKVPVLPPDP